MKSWGVRVGMAGATGLLGLLAIAQAQRDRLGLSAPEIAELQAVSEPLKPIPSMEETKGLFATSLISPNITRGNDQGIQQVGLNDQSGPAITSTDANPPLMAIPSMPSLTAPNLPSMTSSPLAFAAAPAGESALAPSSGPSLSLNVPAMPSLTTPTQNVAVSPPSALSSVPSSSVPMPNPSLNAYEPIGSGVAAPLPVSSESIRINPLPPGNALRDIDHAAQAASSIGAPSLSTPSQLPTNIPSQSQPPSLSSTHRSISGFQGGPANDQGSSTYDRSPTALSTVSTHTHSEPGDVSLDGAQAPSVTIHKKAPAEVKVGQPAPFVIQIRNTGTVTAHQVRVDDQVPKGMRLLDAIPTPQTQGGHLSWMIGDLEPGGERVINLRLIPETEGELGSKASVSFTAAASVRTIATRPELRIKQLAPSQVLVGQQLEVEIEISNPGTGSATDVVLEEDVPVGLEHPKGPRMEYPVGVLQPGEVRRLTLRMMAADAGTVKNTVRLASAEVPVVEDSVAIEVTAPKLMVDLQGPSRRFLERQATFEVTIANQGTAPAGNVEITAYLDRGLTFVSTEFKGLYDANRHAVVWSLSELQAGQSGKVPLKLLPVEEGNRVVRLEARGDLGTKAEREKSITVEALAELTFSVADQHDPIEVGSDTTYEIRVTNHGSRGDSNIQLQVEIPAGLTVLSSDPPAQSTAARGVIFPPLARIDAKGEYSFRITVRGAKAGAQVIRAMLTSDSSQVPVTKEESTLVYADQ